MRWRVIAVAACAASLSGAACRGPSVPLDASFERPGATFLPVDPCNDESDYVSGAGATVRIVTTSRTVYVPSCVKVTTMDSVTIQASVEHPVVGTMETNSSDVSPISMQVTSSDTAYTFIVTGFYSFECPTEDGMKGVVWVAPP